MCSNKDSSEVSMRSRVSPDNRGLGMRGVLKASLKVVMGVQLGRNLIKVCRKKIER